jgi:hypothetical protein
MTEEKSRARVHQIVRQMDADTLNSIKKLREFREAGAWEFHN